MNTKKISKTIIWIIISLIFAGLIIKTIIKPVSEGDYATPLYGSIVSLLPAIIAIVLALITKETYFSLIIGIIIGGLLFASGDILLAGKTVLFNESNGLIANLISESHICILLFVVMLGIIVMLIRKSGAATAFARFASKYIKSAVGAKLAAFLMGVIIFVDDGFNCLSVGTALSPVTDKYKISRAKLAYIIDSTAAPICIIAPISSWAAAVSYSLPSDYNVNGFTLFLHTIPYNLYAFGTLLILLIVIISNRDFGPMRALEAKAKDGELGNETADKLSEDSSSAKGKAMDLIVPMLFLIVACVTMMFAFGGGFSGASIKDAFANTNAAKALVSGSVITIIFMFAFYLIRGVMNLREFMECIPVGWSAFVAPMIILILAWTLSGMTSLLGAGQFIGSIMSVSAGVIRMLVPAFVFIIAVVLSFATGTSWGTFSIMIPIVCNIFAPTEEMLAITISACLAGAVCGDHCSPISDTTIMSSAGAGVKHIDHVRSQMPYAILVACVSAAGYVVIGVIGYYANSAVAMLGLPITLALTVGAYMIISKVAKSRHK